MSVFQIQIHWGSNSDSHTLPMQALASAIAQAADGGSATALSQALASAYATGGCGGGANVSALLSRDL